VGGWVRLSLLDQLSVERQLQWAQSTTIIARSMGSLSRSCFPLVELFLMSTPSPAMRVFCQRANPTEVVADMSACNLHPPTHTHTRLLLLLLHHCVVCVVVAGWGVVRSPLGQYAASLSATLLYCCCCCCC
jgi:hypothetical protein